MSEVSVVQLDQLRKANHAHLLLDVREPQEVDTAAIDGAVNIPMSELPARLLELPRDKEIIVMCHHGQRSEQVAAVLRADGFSNVKNLIGGIEAWSTEVDPSVTRY